MNSQEGQLVFTDPENKNDLVKSSSAKELHQSCHAILAISKTQRQQKEEAARPDMTLGKNHSVTARIAGATVNGSCCNLLNIVHSLGVVCFHFVVVKYP